MDEPVVNHELDPRGGEEVEDRGRLELFACHQLAADRPRVGHEQVGRVGHRVLQRHVAPEAAADRAHARILQIVAGPVGRARFANGRIEIGRGRHGLFLERRFLGIVQVLLAQLVADLDQLRVGKKARQLIPGTAVQQPADALQQRIG